MKVAIEGCCHGCLDKIYKSLSKTVELLIICGDFQSTRNTPDLNTMSVPDKYKQMGDFQDYYTGKKEAPVFTIFIGGNHEASSYLEELRFGGFVAPKIYFMGRSSVIWYKGLRIGGISGIYSEFDFMKLNKVKYDFENDKRDIKSIYHYRKDDYLKLRILEKSNKMIFTSHDWPEGIYNYGNLPLLLKNKPFFKADVAKKCLGSPFNMQLLKNLRPSRWFSAHLHVRFTASVPWDDVSQKKRDGELIEGDGGASKKLKIGKNVDEISLEVSDEDEETDEIELCMSSSDEESEIVCMSDEIVMKDDPTLFLSLDKCLPKRKFLEIIEIEETDKSHVSMKLENQPLYFDHEYIAAHRVIEKHKQRLNNLSYDEVLELPKNLEGELKALKDTYIKEYKSLKGEEFDDLFMIPMNSFVKTADPNAKKLIQHDNPQTQRFNKNFMNDS